MIKANSKKLDTFESPVNWYVARVLIRFAIVGENTENLNRRCTAWENTILVKAENVEEAYSKAIEFGKQEESEYINTDGKKVRWIFEGLTSLLAIYEELEDGAEIIWNEYENKSVKKIKSWVLPKEKLEVFDRN
jgi:type IV secretory pathway VirB9-like protein